MVCCAVLSCKNFSGKISKYKTRITFHRFPRDRLRRQQWEVAVNREAGWTATAHSAVCSLHFKPTEFYVTDAGLRRLSEHAVPSINISACQEPVKSISEVENIEIKPTDTEEVIALRHRVHRLQIIADNRKNRLHLMWQSKKRLKKKLERMKGIIKHLIQIEKDKNGTKSFIEVS